MKLILKNLTDSGYAVSFIDEDGNELHSADVTTLVIRGGFPSIAPGIGRVIAISFPDLPGLLARPCRESTCSV